jgi:nucleoside-diphosphate-sugar epimerase
MNSPSPSPSPSRPILITGAPGWLADAVLAKLKASVTENPHPVRCFVQRGFPEKNLATWQQQLQPIETVSGDLADTESLKAACKKMSGGIVLHSAGIIHPRRTSDWYRFNRDGTLALARAAKEEGVRRFIFVSSNAAQGAASSPQHLLTEEMPCKPLSHYGRSKYEAEQALIALHEKGRFDVVIVRPCMFYGPPLPLRHIDIFKRIQKGRLPLVGGGEYTRSLSYIDDLADGIVLALTHPSAAGEIFNLCDKKPYTTREVCEAMAEALDVSARFFRLPSFSASIAYRMDRLLAAGGFYSMNFHLLGEANWNVGCSSEKAQRLLGFNPKVDVRVGYRRAVLWARERKLL